MATQKKPLKTGSTFFTDANFNVVKFTRKQALAQIKRFKKDRERRFTNGFKYQHCELIEKEEYFCYSLA